MYAVLLTALGVGGATVLGAVLGFVFRDFVLRYGGAILGFGAGVMMAASVLTLILPAIEHGGEYGLAITLVGVLGGAVGLYFINRLLPHMCEDGADKKASALDVRCQRVLLFVIAIALHNLPEGIAAGVGFGTGNLSDALLIAGSIALQNIPEGMVVIGPMLSVGVCAKKTLFYAILTGVIEIVGTLIGYFAVGVATAVLPFSLSFAGGCMLYVISNEIIPEMGQEQKVAPVFALLLGFCLILAFDVLL